MAVARIGASTANAHPARRREVRSGLRATAARQREPDWSWVTMCTSIGPDSWSTVAPMPSENSRASRVRREVPITSWVALVPRANSSSALGTSSPTTVWNVAPTSLASPR